MFITFHDGQVWDQYESHQHASKKTIPLYAYCYDDVGKRWWQWYHSWNNITECVNSNPDILPPIAKAWLLVMED